MLTRKLITSGLLIWNKEGGIKLKIDKWYKRGRIAKADCFFYPNEGIYRGNLYDKEGRIIGDYSSHDSVEIERRFRGIFGK